MLRGLSRPRAYLVPLVGCALALAVFAPPALRAESSTQTLRGNRAGVLGPVPLHAGLLVLHARSSGTENFAVDLITQDPDSSTPVTKDPTAFGDFYEMIDATGRYDGARTTLLKSDDEYYAHVSIVSGPFELTFEQPTRDAITVVHQTEFAGRGQQVTPYFALPAGTFTIAARSGNSALRVWLYGLDDQGSHAIGSDEAGYDEDELIDTTIAPDVTSATVALPGDGAYLISVNPDGAGPRDWTVTIR